MRTGVFFLSAAFCAVLASTPPAGAQTAPVPSPSAAATAPDDEGVMTQAKAWLHRIQTGDIDRTQLDARVNAALTPDVVKQLSAKYGPLGDPVTFSFLGKQPVAGDNTAYVYHVVFKSGAYNEVFVLDKNGKISGIQLPPAQ